MTLKKNLLKKPGVYLVIDIQTLKGKDIGSIIQCSLKAGIDIIQFRDKKASDSEFLKTGKKIKNLLRGKDILFIINDRVRAAFLLDADGVHLGQDDMDIEWARKVLGKKKIIGLSTHSISQMREAAKKDVDYISVGPIFKTSTKPDYKPTGLGLIKSARREIKIPFVAIGGIDESNIRDVMRAGAERVAVVRAILSNPDPFIAAGNLVEGCREALVS